MFRFKVIRAYFSHSNKSHKTRMRTASIKYYLNKKVKPIIIEATFKYPVYVRVSFDRRNDRFKSIWIEHQQSEYDFVNDIKLKHTMAYEEKIIEWMLQQQNDIRDINFRSLLELSLISITTCYFDRLLNLSHIKERLKDYISFKTGFSKEILSPYVRLVELGYRYWIEIANKGILSQRENEMILYYAGLLKFESEFYHDDSNMFEPGLILNYFEWQYKARSLFLGFVAKENLVSFEVAKSITEDFDKRIKEWMIDANK